MAKSTLKRVALGFGLMAGALGLPGVAPLAAWGQVNCGDTIGPGGVVVLTANVGPCATDPALTVVGPVILNLNGFTVSCETIETGGIVVEGTRAIVSNGTVRGCDDGVVVGGAGQHLIARITSRDNDGGGFVIDSNRNTLNGNVADNDRFGFRTNGDSNVLAFNTARGTGFDGFNNDQGADGNRYVSNTSEGNGQEGFEVGGTSNVLKFNQARRNFQGFSTQNSASSNEFAFNVASANDFRGFFVLGDNNRLTRNVATQNGEDGIDVIVGATGNVLERNLAFNNNQDGVPDAFDLEDDNENCDANSWVNNPIGTRNQPCID